LLKFLTRTGEKKPQEIQLKAKGLRRKQIQIQLQANAVERQMTEPVFLVASLPLNKPET
jgi:hypothetical protein